MKHLDHHKEDVFLHLEATFGAKQNHPFFPSVVSDDLKKGGKFRQVRHR